MNKLKKFFGCALVFVLFVPVVSFASDFRFGDSTALQKSEKVTSDLYLVGGSVTSAGNVPGDLSVAGGNILVSGDIGADLTAVGGNITILSNVEDDLRVGGGTVVIQSKVKGDVIVGGGQVTIGGSVDGDVVVGGGNVRIDAPVLGDLRLAGGVIYINAPISGNVYAQADKLVLGSSAVISGDLNYKSVKELTMTDGAVVKGKINFEPRVKKTSDRFALVPFVSAFLIWKFFAYLGCALLFGLVFRRFSKEMVEKVTRHPFAELGRGAIVLGAVPFISILFFVTLIGIPVGILGLLGFVIMLMFSCLVAPIIVGSVVYRYFSKRDIEISWKTIILGVVIYSLVGLIPFIGGLAQFVLMLMTLGSIAMIKWQVAREWR